MFCVDVGVCVCVSFYVKVYFLSLHSNDYFGPESLKSNATFSNFSSNWSVTGTFHLFQLGETPLSPLGRTDPSDAADKWAALIVFIISSYVCSRLPLKLIWNTNHPHMKSGKKTEARRHFNFRHERDSTLWNSSPKDIGVFRAELLQPFISVKWVKLWNQNALTAVWETLFQWDVCVQRETQFISGCGCWHDVATNYLWADIH